jgi:hypothetical protein
MLGVTVYAVEQPQTGFIHYLLFLVLPLSGLTGSAVGLATRAWRGFAFPALGYGGGAVAGVLLASLALAPSLITRVVHGNEYLAQAYFDGTYTSSVIPPKEVVDALQGIVHPGESLAVWGWMPQYLVVTRAIMGTRDSISQFQIEKGPERTYYRDRYLRDMKQNAPEYFLDAVAPVSFAFNDRATRGLESFPELYALINNSYHLVTEVDGIRLFKRND